MNMDTDLTQIGLSKYESLVYNALVRVGKSSSSIISAESTVPYGKIYTVLDSLERKGLVKVIPEKTKMFEAGSPSHLRGILNKQLDGLNKLSSDIEKLNQVYDSTAKDNVFIAKGKRNFYKLQKQRIQAKKSNYLIKYSSDFHPIFVKGIKKALSKKVDIKILAKHDEDTFENLNKWSNVTKNIKEINNTGVGIDIVDEEETMIVLINTNTTLLIKDKDFTLMMKELFTNYYSSKKLIF